MQSSEKNTDGTSTQSVEERVRKEEERIRQEDMGSIGARREGLKLPVILLGAAIYAFGFNVFLLPLHLYAGGMMGFAQLFRDLLSWFGLSFTGINITGILYYIMNIPAFIIALRRMRKRFIVKTIFAVTCVTVMLLVIDLRIGSGTYPSHGRLRRWRQSHCHAPYLKTRQDQRGQSQHSCQCHPLRHHAFPF